MDNIEIKYEVKRMIVELLENESLTDVEQEELLFQITKLSPDPEISDYIFWEDGLTIDEIVEKAFAYKPIILGDQSQNDPEDS
jgi:hypothetical protein